jgi:hypothetical protein
VFACGDVEKDGEIITQFNTKSVVARTGRITNSNNVSFEESGHFDVTFTTPNTNGFYSVMIQPYIVNDYNVDYRLIADVLLRSGTGFTFRLSGSDFAVHERFMFTCIRYPG